MNGALVRLRAVEPGDAAAWHRWLNDPAVTEDTGSRYPVSTVAAARRVAEAGTVTFASASFSVERLDTGALVGWAALRGATPESRKGDLDLVVGERSAWRQGLGTDAARTVCAYAFERMGLHRVYAWVAASHAPARAAYEEAGFAVEGVARERLYRRGAWHDLVLMARLAP